MQRESCRYSKSHEWVGIEADGKALVGLTDFAQAQLGDVVFIDLPKVGTIVEQSKKFGEIESVKAVSELYAPVSGKVVGVNEEAVKQPELVNQSPYGKGWLLRVALSNPTELEKLMSLEEYESTVA